MPLALTEEHRDLADAVAAFAANVAPISETRAHLADHATGNRPEHWDALLRQGLHCVHLPEECGGGGAGILELAVVAEQLGKALLPGPFLPTVLTSAVVATGYAGQDLDAPGRELLTAWCAGATGALAGGGDFTARPSGDGWVVDGCSRPVLGLPGAELVLAEARDPDGRPVWFRLLPVGGVSTMDGVDLTRPVGRLELRGHRVAPEHVLPSPAPERVDLIVNALLAAEASGIMSWCLDTAVSYVKTRVQFGKPVGCFQAVQHKAAMMLVRAELAVGAAWDAARADTDAPGQQRLAAAQAALTAVAPAVDAALECITLLGGIGFTWEHDAHLYWRRAISIASAIGPVERWETRLGDAALAAERDFSLSTEDELPELRARVGAVLDEVREIPDDEDGGSGWAPARGGHRRARLAEAGLVAPHYPAPYGLDAGPVEQAVIGQEFARRGLVQPSMVVGDWVLPTLLKHGTPGQRERFVEDSLRGRIVWCQLFSEPGAGSDLASLATRARRVPGGWSISGQKVWTSMAHEADWGACLARTDPEAPKHKGLSYFLVDMTASGVEVRPLRQATGRTEFNEVFLDDVFVPDECLVGEPGQGWRLAVTTLANERLHMGAMKLRYGAPDRIRQLLADETYLGSHDEALRVLGRNTAREMALSALNLRGALARMSDVDISAGVSVLKVYHAIAEREGSREALRMLGPAGCVADSDAGHHLGLPAILLGGGTIEIQLNVIAQRVLGLPR
ncbi:acyl-CoA dehydrogenase [Amycolatopsis taiwanensis]|uniref:acyl-CoA dehydrogenase n=1 Tax=Amycolatopsis taiwanensis TaxID=342230 RepID=UPI0004850E0B|nr:acyl-CoA dehydrogenase [Amycolatopsis taiwanensis]